jgi:hypothetical protein
MSFDEPKGGWCRDEDCLIEGAHPRHRVTRSAAHEEHLLRELPEFKALNPESRWSSCRRCAGKGCPNCIQGQVPPANLRWRYGL